MHLWLIQVNSINPDHPSKREVDLFHETNEFESKKSYYSLVALDHLKVHNKSLYKVILDLDQVNKKEKTVFNVVPSQVDMNE